MISWKAAWISTICCYWLMLRNFCHSCLLAITHSTAENVLQVWQDVELLVLTWLHHVGMGPSEGCKQQIHVCIFVFWHYRNNSLTEMRRCLCIGKRAFSRVQHSAYQCLLGALWLRLLFISLTLPFSFLCVRASWGQDRAWALKTGSSKLAYLAHYQEVERAPVKYSYHLLTH